MVEEPRQSQEKRRRGGARNDSPFERLARTTASAKTTKAVSPAATDNRGVDNGRGSGLCARAREK